MFAKLIISISDVNVAWTSEVGERFDVYIGCSFLFLNVKTVFFLCIVEC